MNDQSETPSDLREAAQRGAQQGLNDSELAFYGALADSESAVTRKV